MYVFIVVLIVVAAIILGAAVLVQDSKGGGLSSAFGQANQILGARKSSEFIEKLTWGLAIAILVLCFVAAMVSSPSEKNAAGSEISEMEMPVDLTKQSTNTATTPVIPAPQAQEESTNSNE